MRYDRRRLQEGVIDELCEKRSAFVRVSHHHVYHFIVPGISEWLVKGAVGKRRAQDQWMNLTADIKLMSRLAPLRDFTYRLFETHHRPLHFLQHASLELVDDFSLKSGPVYRGRRPYAQVYLLHPPLHSNKKVLHIRHRQLEGQVNLMGPFPVLNKGVKLVSERVPTLPV